jgi:aminoglycoside 3-N-acetyltransferase
MKSPADYSRLDLFEAFRNAGVNQGDIVLVYTSLGRLGRMEKGGSLLQTCEQVNQALSEAVGETGTVLVPSYSYSIGKGEIFDPENTPSTIGPFTEFFRTKPGSRRSREPMLAVSGIGRAVDALFRNLPPSSYGKDSLYDRLVGTKAKICCLGLGLYYATFRHYIEQQANVPFRFHKYFDGVIRWQGEEQRIRWEYFAAPRLENCEPWGHRLEELVRNQKKVQVVPIGRGSLSCIEAGVYLQAGLDALAKNPWFTAKGPACTLDKSLLV